MLAELAEERAAVREAIERLQLTPVLFKLGARPYPPRDVYRAYLEQCQIFIGIYWQRYGWVATGETVSGLEDEYRLSVGMPRLLYVKAPAPAAPTLEFMDVDGLVAFVGFGMLHLLSPGAGSVTSN